MKRSLAVALVLGASFFTLTPTAEAQRRGGWSGGRGGWGGPGWNSGYYGGGYYGGGFYNQPGIYFGGRGWGVGIGTGGIGAGGYYRDSYYPGGSYFTPGSTYYGDTGYYGTPSFSSGAVSTAPRNTAILEVRVPDPNAQLWLNGQLMSSTGMHRVYESPPMEVGSEYSYTVRVSYQRNGQPVTAEKVVPVRANSQAIADFTQVSASTNPATDFNATTPANTLNPAARPAQPQATTPAPLDPAKPLPPAP